MGNDNIQNKKVLFTATVDAHILAFHLPYLKYFKDNGYEVHVATNGTKDIPHTDIKHTVSFERSPLKLGNIKAIGSLKKIIDREKFDIIHTHTPMGSFVTRLAARGARKQGTRVIYTAHGFHFYSGAPMLNWVIYYPVERYMARYTDTLITINHEDYDRAKAKFKTDVQYLPGVGINPKKFDMSMTETEKKNLRASLGLNESDFVLLYPAELNKNKNQKMMIDIMERLIVQHSDIHLLLPGKDSMNGYHERTVNEKNLASNIHLLGYRDDISRLLKIADVSVSTSRREGLPVNIMEAMYVGVPVVATDCRGNRDLIVESFSGYLVPVSGQKALYESINSLYSEPLKRHRFTESAKATLKEYLLDSTMVRYSQLYKREKRKSEN